jgi:anti-anti-sigma factor
MGIVDERSSTPMKLSLRCEEALGVCQIRAEGEICSVLEPRDLREIESLLGPLGYRRRVLFDLQQSPHIDTSGVSWLVHFHKTSESAGGILILYSVPPGVRDVLKLLGLQHYFHLAPDERAARAMAVREKP